MLYPPTPVRLFTVSILPCLVLCQLVSLPFKLLKLCLSVYFLAIANSCCCFTAQENVVPHFSRADLTVIIYHAHVARKFYSSAAPLLTFLRKLSNSYGVMLRVLKDAACALNPETARIRKVFGLIWSSIDGHICRVVLIDLMNLCIILIE